MSNIEKPRFHDEECFGPFEQSSLTSLELGGHVSRDAQVPSSSDLISSARCHYENNNTKAAVDNIIAAYESLAEDKAKLTAIRNQLFRDLSTTQGWHAAPDPQALRLRRLTPTIPIRST